MQRLRIGSSEQLTAAAAARRWRFHRFTILKRWQTTPDGAETPPPPTAPAGS
jgi:hypothetical protein